MRNQARIAVIGAGWWATEWHIPTLLQHPQAELVALVDTNPARLAQAAQHYQVTRTYASVDALLAAETLDGAVVVTNHAAHYAVAKQCLAHDLHVLVEKPLVLDARHGQELVELAQARGKELLVGYTWNFLPFVARASEVVRAGALGAIQAIHCQYNSNILGFLQGVDAHQPRKVHGPGSAYADPTRSGGGHGHTQLTHVIGLLLHITGLRAEQVSALMANHGLISVGPDLAAAYAATLAAEDTARAVCLLRAMNAPIQALPPDTTARLRSAYLEKYHPTQASPND